MFPLILIPIIGVGGLFAFLRKRKAKPAATPPVVVPPVVVPPVVIDPPKLPVPAIPLPRGPYTFKGNATTGYTLIVDDLGAFYDYVTAQATRLGHTSGSESAAGVLSDIHNRFPRRPITSINLGSFGDEEWKDIYSYVIEQNLSWGSLQAMAYDKLQELGIR